VASEIVAVQFDEIEGVKENAFVKVLFQELRRANPLLLNHSEGDS
jgi:hypothetical protein